MTYVDNIDEKAKKILLHYKNIIEDRSFDEYDILGFLIFIRGIIPENEYNYIHEFCNTIAHRNRDRGIIYNSVRCAIESNYELKNNLLIIKNYSGIKEETWYKQWNKAGMSLDININMEIIKDITLCVFSLVQNSIYDVKAAVDQDGDGVRSKTYEEKKNSDKSIENEIKEIEYHGGICLCQTASNEIALLTYDDSKYSKMGCLSKTDKYDFVRTFPAGLIRKPVETVREKGILRLKDEDGFII